MVLKLFKFLARGGGGELPPGLNRVKARLSAKPLNSRVTHFDNERVCTWRPFEVRVFMNSAGRRACFSKETGDEPSQIEE